jgi:hypothetical protein
MYYFSVFLMMLSVYYIAMFSVTTLVNLASKQYHNIGVIQLFVSSVCAAYLVAYFTGAFK